MKNRLKAILRALQLSREDRMIFYTLFAAQLRAGVVPAQACAELEHLNGLAPGIRKLAKAGAQAAREGMTEIDGMAGTGLLPDDELAVLRIADRFNQLAAAAAELVERREEDQGFFSKVVAPNAYYIAVTMIAVGYIWHAEGFFSKLRIFKSESNSLIDLSITVQTWLMPAIAAIALLILLVWHGMRSWYGPARRFLLVFNTQARLQFGIRFAQLAEMMSRRGAVDTEILEAVIDIHRDSRYLQFHARQALNAIASRGEPWEDVLGKGLLLPDHAALLRGMVPGSDMDRYPEAYRAVQEVQRVILNQMFRKMQGFLRVALLFVAFLMIVSIFQGMYSILGASRAFG